MLQRTIVRMIAWLILIMPVAGCGITESMTEENRGTNKPHIANWRSHHEGHLPTDMRFMLRSVTSLMSLETDRTITGAERNARILRELDHLEGTARVTIDGGDISNYAEVSPFMGSFLHDISMAREFATMSPPDYQPATGLIKSCQQCHKDQ